MQQVALAQQLLEERRVGRHIDLAGLGQLALLNEPVEPGQRLRVATHIIVVLHAVHHIGVEQHRDIPALHVAVRQIHGRAAAQRKLSIHVLLHVIQKIMLRNAQDHLSVNSITISHFCQYALTADCQNRRNAV